MEYCRVVYKDELYHHGIKGQKWGIRRFQNKNGGLTSAGRKRYADSDGGESNSKPKAKTVAKTGSKGTAKQKKVYKIPEKKSEHRLKLEEKYKKQGMNDKDAEQAAAKRIHAEKIAAGAAAMTVAAATAYAAYRGYTKDTTLKVDTDFQRVAKSADGKTMREQNAYYVSYKKGDNKRYKAVYGKQLADKENGPFGTKRDVYAFKGKAEKEMKVASSKRARDTFANLYQNNEEFKKAVDESYGGVKAKNVGNGKLAKYKLKGKAYDVFNQGLVAKDENSQKSAKIFYDELKKQGMNAVKDINDKKYSGFSTKDPLIVFDNKINFNEASKITKEYTDKNFNKELRKGLGIHIAKKTPKGAAYAAAGYAFVKADQAGSKKSIQRYRQQGLSESEIAKRFGMSTKQYEKYKKKLFKNEEKK